VDVVILKIQPNAMLEKKAQKSIILTIPSVSAGQSHATVCKCCCYQETDI
jgi:hypothetical protein